MGSVVPPTNSKPNLCRQSLERYLAVNHAKSSIEALIYSLSTFSNHALETPTHLASYLAQIQECAALAEQLRSLNLREPALLKIRTECLRKFEVFEADRTGAFHASLCSVRSDELDTDSFEA